MSPLAPEHKERVIIRLAGDSGEGMQVVGARFTDATAIYGNDFATLPDYPAEIRAPAGTVRGVSSFQIHFASRDIFTTGDEADVLVAMNPAALKAQAGSLKDGATIIVNEDAFTARNLTRAGYEDDPLEDGSLGGHRVLRVPMSTLTAGAAAHLDGVRTRDVTRARNFFALGLLSAMYDRPTAPTEAWIEDRFAGSPATLTANLAALRAGRSFGETTELVGHYRVDPAPFAPGTYRNVTGMSATALGLIAASVVSGLELFFSGYPITPASELLHELARQRRFGVRTVQAEDEIAAAGMALGAAFGGSLAVTATSGPGMDLKAEMIGLAVALELPLVVIDVQRAGPSTGMPTKTEAADLLMALHGRHGESPLPVVAAASPGGCFDAAIEAARIAVTHRTPVILLLDAYLARCSEPWRVPELDELPAIAPRFAEAPTNGDEFEPFGRDANLARPWAPAGTPGLVHRIGGLEHEHGTGVISQDPVNHALMTRLRRDRIDAIAGDIPLLEVDDPDGADILVLGWGSTYGAIRGGVTRIRNGGGRVARAHLRHLRPLPANTGDVLRSFERVLVPELNDGQLAYVLRAEFLVDVDSVTKLEGTPFTAAEIESAIGELT